MLCRMTIQDPYPKTMKGQRNSRNPDKPKHALNIRKWYGTSYIVVFKRGVSNMKGFTYTKKDVKNKIK